MEFLKKLILIYFQGKIEKRISKKMMKMKQTRWMRKKMRTTNTNDDE